VTLTMTINDHLVELGSLVDNKEQSVQRVGARLVEQYFASSSTEQGDEVVVNVLYYLTDIQVRDYALGLMDTSKSDTLIPALAHLMELAPTDTEYMNAPASLLAQVQYEMGNTADALLTLSNAQHNYSLALLLRRVFTSGWEPASFAAMRKELHPKVTAGIFEGDDND
jgi:hypothetical protein